MDSFAFDFLRAQTILRSCQMWIIQEWSSKFLNQYLNLLLVGMIMSGAQGYLFAGNNLHGNLFLQIVVSYMRLSRWKAELCLTNKQNNIILLWNIVKAQLGTIVTI